MPSGDAVSELSPDASVREAAVVLEIEGVSLMPYDSATISVALSRVTSIPLGKAMPSATRRADPSQVTRATIPGGEGLAGHGVEAAALDVGVAATVDHKLVSRRQVGQAAHVAVGDQRAAGLAAQEEAIASRDDEQAAVGQPVDAARE